MVKSPFISELEDEYRRYLSEVRSLSPRSIENHIKLFRRFGDFLKARRVRAARRVSLSLTYAFLEECARTNARKSMRTIHWYIRSILRFLHFRRILPTDLSGRMITPRSWKLADLPAAFSEKEIARMLANLRAKTPYDQRERAVMLLFMCYGLRLGEATGINMDDVDLHRKTITIRQRKSGAPLVLPLLPQVEEALLGYREHARPKNLKTRRLFVSIRRRKRARLKWMGIYHIIKKFLRRCGLEGSATKFRHTLATRLINSGVRLEAIQAVLGHQLSDSTRVYAKVHWKALREVAENHSLLL